jgi:hypothetical protein
MKIGDKVKLIEIPADVRQGARVETRALFEKCLGKSFPIVNLKSVEGLPYELIELEVGHALGKAAYMDSIWVEPEYVEVE